MVGTAAVLEISRATVERAFKYIRVWLSREPEQFFDEKSAEWREEQERVQATIDEEKKKTMPLLPRAVLPRRALRLA